MALPDFTTSPLGGLDGSAGLDLFLKVWAGEVYTAFRKETVSLSRHTIKTISAGKSAKFDVLGKGAGSYHTLGTMIDGTVIKQNERVISIDDKFIAARVLADLDEAMNHYDSRAPYTKDMADTLSQKWDINVLNTALLAARASATVNGEDGGSAITSATSKTDAVALRNAIYSAVQKFAEKNIKGEQASVFLKPAQYYLLIDDPKIVNRDFTAGANGGVDSGVILRVGGLPLVMTNNLPATDMSADTSLLSKYRVNASTTSALVFSPSAVGTVKLMDMKFEAERSIQHQGHFMVASYAFGSGILRPECAIEIKTA